MKKIDDFEKHLKSLLRRAKRRYKRGLQFNNEAIDSSNAAMIWAYQTALFDYQEFMKTA